MVNHFKLLPKKIQKTLVIYRSGTGRARSVALELRQWLEEKNIQVYGSEHQSWPEEMKKIEQNSLEQMDLIVVLGGDGTYLEAVRVLEGKNIPILGINMGSLGFLTETRVEEMYKTLELALAQKMEMRPRSMIQVMIQGGHASTFKWTALNDVVIERGGGGHMITLSAYCEDYHVSDYKADGLIIASPTGSTAYNLAAGGPILHPEDKSFVVTPICPHSLTNRPIIFPDDKTLSFKLKKGRRPAVLTVDGQFEGELTHEQEVFIQRAPYDHFVLRRPSHNYFDLLREKLNFGTRAVF